MSTDKVKKHNRSPAFSRKTLTNVCAFAILLSACIFSVTKLENAEYFPISNVKVFGINHLDRQEMETLLAPFVNKGFFAVDIDRIKEQVLQLPWVGQVVVRRTWPDQVMIAIREKSPIAVWNDNSLLSSAGELFSPSAESYPAELPEFSGPAGEQILMSQYYAKMNSLLTPLHFKITRLELSPSMAWRLTLENGMKLNVGHKDVLTRLTHFVKVYPKIVGERVAEVEYIDLRYPNGMAVRWKSVT